MALNISWKSQTHLYQDLLKVSTKIKQRRMKLAGRCSRHSEKVAHKLVFWESTERKQNRRKGKLKYVAFLLKDTKTEINN